MSSRSRESRDPTPCRGGSATAAPNTIDNPTQERVSGGEDAQAPRSGSLHSATFHSYSLAQETARAPPRSSRSARTPRRQSLRPSSPRWGSPLEKRATDPRRTSATSIRRQGHVWRSRWHHHGAAKTADAASLSVSNKSYAGVSGRARVLVDDYNALPPGSPYSPCSRAGAAAADAEQRLLSDTAAGDSAEPMTGEGALHRYLRDWYGTFLRSRHARQCDQIIAAYIAQSQAEYSEEEDAAAAAATPTARTGTDESRTAAEKGKPFTPRVPVAEWAADASSPLTVEPPTAACRGSGEAVVPPALSAIPLVTKPRDEATKPKPLPAGTALDYDPPSFQHRLRTASYKEVLGLGVFVVMVLAGNALQVIALNFWLRQYPTRFDTPGNYTTLAVSSMVFSAFFLLAFGVYYMMERPDMRFVWHKHGGVLLLCVGCADLACSCLTIYAASHTSEILQALFTSTGPLFTAYFQKRILRDPRRYCNRWVVVAFVFIVTGVFLASSYGLLQTVLVAVRAWGGGLGGGGPSPPSPSPPPPKPPDHRDGAAPHGQNLLWSFLFFCSVIPSAVQNVVQTKYMLCFTRDPLFERWAIVRAAALQSKGAARDPHAATEATRDHDADCAAASSTTTPSMESRERPLPQADSLGSATIPTVQLFDFVNATTYRSPLLQPMSPLLRIPPHAEDRNRAVAYGTFPPTSAASVAPPAFPHTPSEEYAKCDSSPLSPPLPLSPSVVVAGAHRHDAHESSRSPDITPLPFASAPHAAPVVEEGVATDVENGSMYSISCECTRVRVGYRRIVPGEDLVVKLVLLAVDTTTQAIGALLLLPMDALPFWGNSKSVREAAADFASGLSCVLHCKNNMMFGLLYCMGFVLVYIGAVYLDQFSVTFCSMVTQLAAPCTALLLIVYPSLNLTGDLSPWWLNCAAIGFLATGTILFTVWDQKTTGEKMEGENEVKTDYVRPFIVVEREGAVREFSI